MDDKDGTLMENHNSKNFNSKIFNDVIPEENFKNLQINDHFNKISLINVKKKEEK